MSAAVTSILAGCAGQVPPGAQDTALVPTENCRDFIVQVAVEGQPRQAVGQTCRQPDGSWQVTLDTPGLPQQVYTLPPQAIEQSSYPDPAYWWNPLFYGPLFYGPSFAGPVFLAQNHRHHHHHSHFNGASHKGGSRHGGSHGGRK